MADKNQLPDWRDFQSLTQWLEGKPSGLQRVFAIRMALIALPGLVSCLDNIHPLELRRKSIQATSAAIVVSWGISRRPRKTSSEKDDLNANSVRIGEVMRQLVALTPGEAFDAINATANAILGIAADENDKYTRVSYVNLSEPLDSTKSVHTSALTARAARALFCAARALSKEGEELFSVIIEDELHSINVAQELNEQDSYIQLHLWPGGQMPDIFKAQWETLKASLDNKDWGAWLDWVEARYAGGPDWPKRVYDELTKWRDEWDRPPAEVNADILRLLEEFARPSSPLPGPGPTTPIVIQDFKVDFGEPNKIAGSNAEALKKHGAKLCEQLLQANFDVPPDLSAALRKLSFWLNRDLSSISPIDLRIAVTALAARTEAYAIVAPDDVSVHTMSALRELNETMRGVLEMVIPDLRANTLAIQELNLSSLPAQAVESTIDKSAALYEASPAIAPRLAEQHKLIVEISKTATDQTVRIVAQGNAVLQSQEIVRTLAQHLSEIAGNKDGATNEATWLADETSKAALHALIVSVVSLAAGTNPATTAVLFGAGFVWLRYYARHLLGDASAKAEPRIEPTLNLPNAERGKSKRASSNLRKTRKQPKK